jgi:hypothetical protein
MSAAVAARALAVCVLSVPWLAGCDVSFDRVPTETERRVVELDQTESVNVDLTMGAGELVVQGGSTNLMNAEFTYGPAAMKPLVDYTASGSAGHLRIQDPSRHGFNHAKARWNLQLNDRKPIDLDVSFGAGQGRLTLGRLNLRAVNIQMGVGQLTLDLRGTPRHDYDVNIRGGVGQATIHLPSDVAIVADVKGGIGDVSTGPLVKRDGHYVSQDAEAGGKTVRFDIRGGVGSIRLIGS